MSELKVERNKAGVEDLLFGTNPVSQTRNGKDIIITAINADNIPYDDTQSIKAAIDNIDITAINADTIPYDDTQSIKAAIDNIDVTSQLTPLEARVTAVEEKNTLQDTELQTQVDGLNSLITINNQAINDRYTKAETDTKIAARDNVLILPERFATWRNDETVKVNHVIGHPLCPKDGNKVIDDITSIEVNTFGNITRDNDHYLTLDDGMTYFDMGAMEQNKWYGVSLKLENITHNRALVSFSPAGLIASGSIRNVSVYINANRRISVYTGNHDGGLLESVSASDAQMSQIPEKGRINLHVGLKYEGATYTLRISRGTEIYTVIGILPSNAGNLAESLEIGVGGDRFMSGTYGLSNCRVGECSLIENTSVIDKPTDNYYAGDLRARYRLSLSSIGTLRYGHYGCGQYIYPLYKDAPEVTPYGVLPADYDLVLSQRNPFLFGNKRLVEGSSIEICLESEKPVNVDASLFSNIHNDKAFFSVAESGVYGIYYTWNFGIPTAHGHTRIDSVLRKIVPGRDDEYLMGGIDKEGAIVVDLGFQLLYVYITEQLVYLNKNDKFYLDRTPRSVDYADSAAINAEITFIKKG